MSEKRKVRGLLEYIEAEASGEEWECAEPSPDWVPGMGSGATAEATRWAYKGWLLERYAAFPPPPPSPKRGRGQPQKHRKLSNDGKRAFLLYLMARAIRDTVGSGPSSKIEMPLFEMIDLTKKTFRTRGLFAKPKAPNKMYGSVKRGREIFGIDEYWRGPPPESLFNSE